ncbi:protein kinase [Desulfovibrio sp. OttesenSCG-928-M16]|nr:protein kinase [Desulfovibrio sp. OttesenSCG-928-M16]
MPVTPISTTDPTIDKLLNDFLGFDVQHVHKKDKTGGVRQPGNGQPTSAQPRTNIESRQNLNVVLPKQPDVQSLQSLLQQCQNQVSGMKQADPMTPALATKLVNLLEDAKAQVHASLKDRLGYRDVSHAIDPDNRQAMLNLLPQGPERTKLAALLTICNQGLVTMNEGLRKAAFNVSNPAQPPKLQTLTDFLATGRNTLAELEKLVDKRDIDPEQASKLMNLAESSKAQVARIFKGIDGYKDMPLTKLIHMEQSLPLAKLSPAQRQQVTELRELRTQCLAKLYGAKGIVRQEDLKRAQDLMPLLRNGAVDGLISLLPQLFTGVKAEQLDAFFAAEAKKYNKTQMDTTRHVTGKQLRAEFDGHLKPLKDVLLSIREGKPISKQDMMKFQQGELKKLTLSTGFKMQYARLKHVRSIPNAVADIASLSTINALLHSGNMEKISIGLTYMPLLMAKAGAAFPDIPESFFDVAENPLKGRLSDIGFTELKKLPAFQALSESGLPSEQKQQYMTELQQQLTHLVKFNPVAGIRLALDLVGNDNYVHSLKLTGSEKLALRAVIQETVASHMIKTEDVPLGDKMGEGGQGQVFSATYQGKEVLGKILQKEAAGMVVQGDSFLENLALQSLPKHPNLVGFIGIIPKTRTNPPVMIMEKVPGPDLSTMIASETTELKDGVAVIRPPQNSLLSGLNETDRGKVCLHIFKGAIKGLAAMHGTGLSHLDIKPPNLVLNNQSLEVQIIDFGSTRATAMGHKGSSQTPLYAPGDDTYDTYSDIYSLGVSIGDLMSGDPFKRPSITDKLSEPIALDDPVWKQSSVQPIKNLIMLCIDPVPANRPTAQQLVQIMENKPVALAKEGENGIKTQAQLDTLKAVLAPGGPFDGGREILANKLNAS